MGLERPSDGLLFPRAGCVACHAVNCALLKKVGCILREKARRRQRKQRDAGSLAWGCASSEI